MKPSLLLATMCLMLAANAQAASTSVAVYSPKCDLKKVKELLKDVAISVEKGAFDGGHNVTFEGDKSAEITKILNENGCAM